MKIGIKRLFFCLRVNPKKKLGWLDPKMRTEDVSDQRVGVHSLSRKHGIEDYRTLAPIDITYGSKKMVFPCIDDNI